MASKFKHAQDVSAETFDQLLDFLEECVPCDKALQDRLDILRAFRHCGSFEKKAITLSLKAFVSDRKKKSQRPPTPGSFRKECSELSRWLLEPASCLLELGKCVTLKKVNSEKGIDENLVVALALCKPHRDCDEVLRGARSRELDRNGILVETARFLMLSKGRRESVTAGSVPADTISGQACGAASRINGVPMVSLCREKKLADPTLTPSSSRGLPAIGPENFELTVVVCSLMFQHSPSGEAADRILEPYKERFRWAVRRYLGQVEENQPGQLTAFFGLPGSSEMHARIATKAAWRAMREIKQLAQSPSEEPHPAAYIVLHTCEAVVQRSAGGGRMLIDLDERASAMIQRMLEMAKPQAVLACARVYALNKNFFRFLPVRGESATSGTPPHAYEVTDEKDIPTLFSPAEGDGIPLVGRDKEFNVLKESWELAKAGTPRVIWVQGMMGIGKSRLIYELTTHLRKPDEPVPLMLVCQCWDCHQCTDFYPVAQMLKSQLNIRWEPSAAKREDKLRRFVRRFGLEPQDFVPILGNLIANPTEEMSVWNRLDVHERAFQSAEAGQRREQMLDALEMLLWTMAARIPVLLLVKDLHWADSSTRELLHRVRNRLARPNIAAKILIVISQRRGSLPHPPIADGIEAVVTLKPLEEEHARKLVSCVALGVSRLLSESDITAIVAAAGGDPHLLRERAAGDHGPVSWFKKVLSEAEGGLEPPKDATGPRSVHVAQLAAMLGRSFLYEHLRAVVFPGRRASDEEDVALERQLQHLVDAQILCVRGRPPQATYLFPEYMFDCVIKSLTKDTTESLHYRFGEILEARLSNGEAIDREVLARQYSQAGVAGADKAVDWWSRVAEVAMNRSAYNEAIGAIDEALKVTSRIPESKERKTKELRLWLDRALASGVVQTSADVKRIYSQAMLLAKEVHETELAFRAQWGQWLFTYVHGQLASARSQAEELVRAPACHDPQCRLEAFHAMWDTLFHLGHLRTALAYHFHGATIPDPVSADQHRRGQAGHAAQVCCLARGGLVFWLLGFVDQAVDVSWRAIKLAESLKHPNSIAQAHCHAALLHLLRRSPAEARKHAEDAKLVAGNYGLAQRLVMAEVLDSAAVLQDRPSEDSAAQLRKAISDWRKTGVRLFETFWLASLAQGYLATRSIPQGIEAIQEAMAIGSEVGECFFEPELHRLYSELLAMQRPKERTRAIASANTAIQLAIETDARSLELRALGTLNRLLETDRHSESRNDARLWFAKTYKWFREGFDTLDLREARAFLERHSR